ncbi:ABC transporter permease subunit [Mesoterricola sediminis]|uniref:ABC transmembrane type-1 domain-containing protein n=1 Tax=Mesoterricola sediminis TaxID=2927980 RepID=A0AA48GSP7_9BACT|nr:ABC transporter permease subunit [Mesoterricola sediminis]BDU76959.1 hypothetical protein METESE_19170 [Mesoterricola sediminis]
MSSILDRAKRLDGIMHWVITLGGMTIIAAVLGILVFIGSEALPLFRSPRSRELAPGALPPGAALAVDETGRGIASLDPRTGLAALGDGQPITPAASAAPALPWTAPTPLDAQGRCAVVDAQGRLFFLELAWSAPSGEATAPWGLEARWTGAMPAGNVRLLAAHPVEGGGLADAGRWRLAALDAQGRLVWAETEASAQAALAWKPLPLPEGADATCAAWNPKGTLLFAGTRQGAVHAILLEDAPEAAATVEVGEPVTALGFALGQTSLLVGGARGGMVACQLIRAEGPAQLQLFHRFQPLDGPVKGFMASQRDKRFLAWSATGLAVDHLTTERRLFAAPHAGAITAGALSPRGDRIYAAVAGGPLREWSLDAPHPEISGQALWGKVHYESYPKAEYVWQSSGGTDDFEPKLSLVPLVFGTLKGTLYAMVFALPLAILGALYTSQFASPGLRDIIKPLVEIMAALPSVVLGFLAGLVLAPLFERSATVLLVLPAVSLGLGLVLLPLWRKLPNRVRLGWGTGWEVLWLVPLLAAAALISVKAGPLFERAFLGGDFRTWLLSAHHLTYDQRNSLVVGFAMGFAVIPIIFTISEDALSAVPRSLASASLACGASPWQTAWRVVLPTASPGIFSAVMVGLGRAIGETMIVLMATGNTPVLDWSPFNGMRTLAANIAVETPEAPVHGTLYRLLFFTAALLFALTFLLNTAAELVRQRLRKRYETF